MAISKKVIGAVATTIFVGATALVGANVTRDGKVDVEPHLVTRQSESMTWTDLLDYVNVADQAIQSNGRFDNTGADFEDVVHDRVKSFNDKQPLQKQSSVVKTKFITPQ